MSNYLVQFNNISKFFGKVIALKDVTMRLKKGEIMCLLGDNGAGKSTLIKTLAGVHKPDEGEIIFEAMHEFPIYLQISLLFFLGCLLFYTLTSKCCPKRQYMLCKRCRQRI